ncbi:cell adhesion molecule Dscam1 [Parasteatoda tepidariorum]
MFRTISECYFRSFWWIIILSINLQMNSAIREQGEPPVIVPFSFSENLSEGDNAKVPCVVTKGDSPLKFRWFLNNKGIQNGSQFHISTQPDISVLVVKQLTGLSSGNFTCQVNNAAGKDTHTASLVVNAPPKWLKEPQSVEMELGSAVTLDCAASGYPEPRITWSRIKGSSSADIPLTVRNGSLYFNPLLNEHRGDYVCEARNSVGLKLRKTITLSVLGESTRKYHFKLISLYFETLSKYYFRAFWEIIILYINLQMIFAVQKRDFSRESPVIMPFSFSENLSEGDNAKVACVVTKGDSPLKFRWFLNNKEIQNGSQFHINTQPDISILVVKQLSGFNRGNFTCQVNNAAGKDTYTASLVLKAPPKWTKEPQSVEMELGSAVTLDCAASGYPEPRITWSRVEGSSSTPLTVRNGSLHFNPLLNEHRGDYVCEARNSVGLKLRKTITLSVLGELTKKCLLSTYFASELFCLRAPVVFRKNYLMEALLVPSVEQLYISACSEHIRMKMFKTLSESFWWILFLQTTISAIREQDVPAIQPFNFPPRLSEGQSAKVLCNILQGKRPISFEWLRNGEKISEKNKISNQGDFSVLIVNNIGSDDGGNYTCIASNEEGAARHSAQLTVEASPQWLEAPDDTTGTHGSYLHLHCLASGLPPPRVTWFKGDEVIGSAGGRMVAPGNGSLIISILNEEDEALYRCLAHNGVGEALAKQFKISVNVPARFEDKFTVITVKKGDSANVRCEAVGDQPLSVIWKREGKELRKINGGRYEIFETLTPKGLKSELVLREANRADGQLYTCVTENPYGKDERNIKLLVMEVPATPLDLKVQEIWSRSVSVSWSPPYTGNSPITKYVIQYWKDAVSGGGHRLEEKGVTSAQTSALIKDLHSGTNYGLAIVAENTVGRGEPSDTLSFTTGDEEPSSAPMDVNVDVKGTASLLVAWKPPLKSEWNGKLKGYYVGYKMLQDSSHPYSFKTVEYVPGGIQEHMISSLRKDTEYSVIVKAFNSAGSGPPSQEVIIRTLGGDLPAPPVVFVVSTTENTIKIQWRSVDTKSKVSGHAVHYRRKGESWQRVAVTSPTENSYTLTGLHSGSFYQLYVTANGEYGEGDPSDVVTVKTYAENNKIFSSREDNDDDQPMMLDMSLMIPVAASLLAVTVVIIAVCIWILKAKSRRDLERAIQEDKRFIYAAAATQRYVDIDKTRSLPAYHDPALLHYPTPYATVPMGEELLIEEPNQEMKAFLATQNMMDRPLPNPGGTKQRDSHIYDSPH